MAGLQRRELALQRLLAGGQRLDPGLPLGARRLARAQRLLEVGAAALEALDRAPGAGQLLRQRVARALRGRDRAGGLVDPAFERLVAGLKRCEPLGQPVTLAVQVGDLRAQLSALGLEPGQRPAQPLARGLQLEHGRLRRVELLPGLGRFGLERLLPGLHGRKLIGERGSLRAQRLDPGLPRGAGRLARGQHPPQLFGAALERLDLAVGVGQLLRQRIARVLGGRERRGGLLEPPFERLVAGLKRCEALAQPVTLAAQVGKLGAQLFALALQPGHGPAQALAGRRDLGERGLRHPEPLAALGGLGLERRMAVLQGRELGLERLARRAQPLHLGLGARARLAAVRQRPLEIGGAALERFDLAFGAGQLLLHHVARPLGGGAQVGGRREPAFERAAGRLQRAHPLVQLVALGRQAGDLGAQLRALGLQLR